MRVPLLILLALLVALPVRGANPKDELKGVKREIKVKKQLITKTRKVEAVVSSELRDINRNLEQNELGMLRRERAQTETIYIQAPDKKAREEAQAVGQTHMEILDFLLGLLNVFHIGE